jgi:hypothetical protein
MNGTWDKEGDHAQIHAQIRLPHPLGLSKIASQTLPGVLDAQP